MPTLHERKVLRRSLLALGVVVCTMLPLVGYSDRQKAQARLALQQQQSQLGRALLRWQTSGAEKNMRVHYLPLYLNLVRRGFVGEERRTEWIDALRAINHRHKLFGITYNFAAQEGCQPPFNTVTGTFALHCSSMKIEMPLLHEGDLLTIINALNSRRYAPFVLRACVLSGKSVAAGNEFVPNLNASCEFDWLTVTAPLPAQGQP